MRLVALVVLTMSLCTVQGARAQVQWWPTEVALTTGRWVAEEGMQGQVDGMALGAQVAWMTRATNGWAAFFNGVEHGGFVGLHRIGASAYGLQGQAGWTLRTNQTRLVGWSFTGGVAYNPTTYHPEDAPDLIAVGSNWNGLVRLGLTLANDSRVSLGLGLSHTSNGALRRPNKGVNTPHARLIVRPTAVPTDGWLRMELKWALGAMCSVWVWGARPRSFGGHVLGCRNCLHNPHSCGRRVSGSRPSWRWRTTARCGPTPTRASPSDTLATSVEDRLQPGWSVGWTWLFGRARLDLLKGGVLDNPTPGFKTRYNKAQILMAVHPSLDVFAALRFSHLARRLRVCRHRPSMGTLGKRMRFLSTMGHVRGNPPCRLCVFLV
jgi:hypothetical protein